MLFISKKGAAAPAFVPTDLANLFAWYDPSDLSSMYTDDGVTNVTSDGDLVYRIDDKSGNGWHLRQTTAASRPLYKTGGGLHWLQFDGTDDYLSFTSISNASSDYTVCFGMSGGTIATTGRYLFDVQSGRLILAYVASSPYEHAYFDGTWRYSGAATSGPQVLTFRLANGTGTATVRQDGSVVFTGNYAAKAFSGSANIGRHSTTSFGYYNGNLYSIVITTDALASGDLSSLESYSAGKSGVTL